MFHGEGIFYERRPGESTEVLQARAAAAGMLVEAGKHEVVAAASGTSPGTGSGSALSSSPGMTRVYMGGLGGGVTEADVEKTFGPLGRVSNVEFVRNKGRAFAFMDFEPRSEKSLTKLFATYNGCTWKGGKLRLEKAKEHYLYRLRRGWIEDAESTSKPVVEMSKDFSSNKSKSMTEEKMQLRIFFPKLRKVKALPFKGTGKHKYSFQRIAAPSLPLHFCDCEEHCQSSEDPNQDQSSCQKVQRVVNEEESNIMNSVLNRLLEKEENAGVADGKACSATRRDNLGHTYNETQFGDNEASQQTETDADNLVTNIGLEHGEDVLKGWDAASADQVSIFGKRQAFHVGLVSEKQNLQKRRITGSRTASEVPFSKRTRLPLEKNKSKDRELSSMVSGEMRHQETGSQEWSGFPATQSLGSNCPTEDPEINSKTSQNPAIGQSDKGTSWIQKSSWKELVGGDTGSSTFTISHLLPGIGSLRGRSSKSNGTANIRSDAVITFKPQSDGSYLKPVEPRENIPAKKMAQPRHELKSSEEDEDRKCAVEGDADKAPTNSDNQESKAATVNVSIGQVCTFMRSADSEKEWTRAKAALSGYFKNKKNESRTSGSTRVTLSRR